MLLLEVRESLAEVKSLVVSSCLLLLGKRVDPQRIEDCIVGEKFQDLSLEDIMDIVSYSNVVDFLQECEKQHYKIMTGTLAIALCSFILRKISISRSFLKDNVSFSELLVELDSIFSKAESAESVAEALKIIIDLLPETRFIVSDLEAFTYIILNYYLYNFYNRSVVVFDDSVVDGDYSVGEYFSYLCDWVNML